MGRQLKAVDKVNPVSISWLKREPLRFKDEIFQLSKNIILVDNAENC